MRDDRLQRVRDNMTKEINELTEQFAHKATPVPKLDPNIRRKDEEILEDIKDLASDLRYLGLKRMADELGIDPTRLALWASGEVRNDGNQEMSSLQEPDRDPSAV